MDYLVRQKAVIERMLEDPGMLHNQIRVVRSMDGEFFSAGSLGVNGDKNSYPQAMVFAPIFVGLEGKIVLGFNASIFGPFSDQVFDFESFIDYADGDNFRTLTGGEAREIVKYLTENPEAGRRQ